MSTVLVTRGSGFVGGHAILKLLSEGNDVRTTVRHLKKEKEIRSVLGVTDLRLKFYEADLNKEAGWTRAIEGCDFVLHVASPFPSEKPKDENELIVPAREGALRILRASRDAKVKRVVLTSSFAAIGYGYRNQAKPFDETTWTNLEDKSVPAYHKSKTLAEKAAWEFITTEGGQLELSVINPVGIFGPALSKDLCSSLKIVENLLSGEISAYPKIYFGAVDVRDVVDLHLTAMTHPSAKGERFIATACESTSLAEIAQILRKNLGTQAKKISTRELPNFLVRVGALLKPEAREILPDLGKKRLASNDKAKRLLAWRPRSLEEALVSSAESLIKLGFSH